MVFVLDKRGKPLMPCSEKRARLLLVRRRAVVHRRFPFTIRLKDRCVQDSHVQSFRLKLDPGSKITGWALLQDAKILALGELVHKPGIKHALDSRRALRQGRRSRKTRYRQPRFLNRVCRKKKGWLSPSLAARVQQTMHLVAKLRRSVP